MNKAVLIYLCGFAVGLLWGWYLTRRVWQQRLAREAVHEVEVDVTRVSAVKTTVIIMVGPNDSVYEKADEAIGRLHDEDWEPEDELSETKYDFRDPRTGLYHGD